MALQLTSHDVWVVLCAGSRARQRKVGLSSGRGEPTFLSRDCADFHRSHEKSNFCPFMLICGRRDCPRLDHPPPPDEMMSWNTRYENWL